ncbi:MAG: hypothetical protein CVV11_12985 [Gammaproteobacteria bacterium HGW-Gammaproteobacteria-15]|nr:MAG: hypothetical protein CVV11_12985 [Gammaproteobacteria bacterium HGW-Gammaproteobacteria-15]
MPPHNQAFSASALKRCICPDDFFNDKQLSADIYRDSLVDKALEIANNNFEHGIKYSSFYISEKDKNKNKPTFFSTSLEEKLVLRRCASNIRSSLSRKQNNRAIICREIKGHLSEGTPYRIYKIDIKSFFESIQQSTVKEALDRKSEISIHTKNLVISYLANFKNFVPRGIEFSSTLAELVLEDFDDKLLQDERIIYYSRYVDDIIIITNGLECNKKFYKDAEAMLPKGINFNYNKKQICDVKLRTASSQNPSGTIVAKFDYLGYEFNVIDTKLDKTKNKNINLAMFREVKINIAKNKIKSIKTKISKALIHYGKTGKIEILKSRIKFLTSNRDLVQKSTGHSIPTGIYYNYNLISEESESLIELDETLSNFVMKYDSLFKNNDFKSLTMEDRRSLLNSSFRKGFGERVYKKFSPNQLKEIVRIWK